MQTTCRAVSIGCDCSLMMLQVLQGAKDALETRLSQALTAADDCSKVGSLCCCGCASYIQQVQLASVVMQIVDPEALTMESGAMRGTPGHTPRLAWLMRQLSAHSVACSGAGAGAARGAWRAAARGRRARGGRGESERGGGMRARRPCQHAAGVVALALRAGQSVAKQSPALQCASRAAAVCAYPSGDLYSLY